MKLLSSIASIAGDYDAFLLDLWGVIHDGEQLYPDVYESLVSLKKDGKNIIFLSNAPRRAARAAAVLDALGIEPALYDTIVTSGEVGHRWLADGLSGGSLPFGKRYYFIGASKDEDLLHDLDFEQVVDIRDADFILNLGFGSDEQTAADFTLLLKIAGERKIPMLCLNPDLEVIKLSGARFPCAGVIAKEYIKLGGEVAYFGKPYSAVYEHCHRLLPDVKKSKILAVGDGLETDILGAKNFGIDCVLVMGGILRGKSIAEIEELCLGLAVRPDYMVSTFGVSAFAL